ncbi:anti-sigma factor [Streptomyces chromofuscus]|uniref:Anti-sigma factor n=1 Tax=Streptomyces chromofuscus TaxID=42881 RepID=A0A7M2T5X7_STRCW|nr:anti-sigma factor [Streptomyces chromofuscus]QOV43559.1 anti-sigma factor [Streptomyces chromofuscus]GGT10487.1 hypothetical protein GCM10010254_33930 [Streptomyces chromofuscus]
MEHTDEETLAAMALGEPAPPAAAEHVRTCARCGRELNALRRVVSAARAPMGQDEDLDEPPAGLWDAVAGELGLASRSFGATRAPGPLPRAPKPTRSRRLTVVLAACAALLGAAAGGGITWWAAQEGSSNGSSSAPSAAGERLDSLRPGSAGYARLTDGGGHRTLDVTVTGLPRTSGYFEVWLMDRTHSKLVSLGVLGPDGHAALPVPENVDLGEYSLVDVSVQPYNGDPEHSGDSLVRGPHTG